MGLSTSALPTSHPIKHPRCRLCFLCVLHCSYCLCSSNGKKTDTHRAREELSCRIILGLQPSAQHCSHPTMQPRGVLSSPLGPLMLPISAFSQATMQPREEGLSFWKGHCLQIYLMQLLQEILFQHLCSCAGLQVLHSAQGSLLGIVQLIVQL